MGRFRFEASAIATRANSLLAAEVTVPGGASFALPRAANQDEFELTRTNIAASAEALAASYPTGTYTFRFNTLNDGAKTSAVNIASTQLPPIPFFRNYPLLKTMNSQQVNTISFDAWEGANTNTDSIRLTVYDVGGTVRFESDDEDVPATTNRITIPDEKLTDKTVYIARLRFERRDRSENTSLYPGARASTRLFSETAVYIATMPDFKIRFLDFYPGTTNINPNIFTVGGLKSAATYALLASPDLKTWTEVKRVKIPVGEKSQKVTNNIVGGNVFYRWEYLVPL
jgi:hypothetical protein